MNKAFLVTIAALLAGGLAYLGFDRITSKGESPVMLKEQWEEYTPTSGRFTVFLPGIPQYVRDVVDIPDTKLKRYYEVYASEEKDSTVYMISVITYPKEFDTKNPEELLDGIIREFSASRPDNKLGNVEKNHQEIPPNSDFTIENGEFTIKGHALVKDQTMIVLSCIAPKDLFNEKEYEMFIKSFKLLNTNNSPEKPL